MQSKKSPFQLLYTLGRFLQKEAPSDYTLKSTVFFAINLASKESFHKSSQPHFDLSHSGKISFSLTTIFFCSANNGKRNATGARTPCFNHFYFIVARSHCFYNIPVSRKSKKLGLHIVSLISLFREV